MSLLKIQSELKAPKNQFNSFGKYKYRSTEDILEALKPLLLKYECTMVISDNIKEKANIIYCESAVLLIDKQGQRYESCASAGIDPNRKGMDISQSFGSSSSYSRKYALSALFLLDDTKDADATNMHDAVKMVEEKLKPILKVGTELFDKCRAGYLKDAKNLTAIQERYSMDAETLRFLICKPNTKDAETLTLLVKPNEIL
jgi:hypothetical protein